PAFSAGWRIAQEDFMANTKDWLTDLKLRASWGRLGSLNSLNLYPYQQTFAASRDYIFSPDDGNLQDGAAVTALANENLKWEETETFNIGIDVELFSRFFITADFYQRNT
ncbi:MAG: TonB-dependent receptor, partial [Bacteroidota bacterium]